METIFVKLRNEEIDVWRPVYASFNSTENGFYIELPPINIIPSDEEWEFLPGMLVRTSEKRSGDEVIKIAVAQII